MFSRFSAVGPDGDGAGGVKESLVVAGGAAAVVGDANAQDEVGVEVGGLFQSPAAGVQGMFDGNGARVAHHRHSEAFRQGGYFGDGVAFPDAVAGVEQGAAGVAQGVGHGVHIGVGRVAGAELGQFALNNVGGVFLGAQQPVVHGQMHRAHGRRHRHAEGAFHGGGQALRFNHRPVGFGEGRGDGGGAGVVADVKADFAGEAAGVAGEGNHDDGKAARPDIDQLAHSLGQAGAQVNHHYAGGQVGLGVAAGHSGDRPLVEAQDAVDVGAGMEFVEKQGLARAGVVEYILDAGSGQLLHHQAGCGGGHLPGLHCGSPCCQSVGRSGRARDAGALNPAPERCGATKRGGRRRKRPAAGPCRA